VGTCKVPEIRRANISIENQYHAMCSEFGLKT
jgi:hypothetical protein